MIGPFVYIAEAVGSVVGSEAIGTAVAGALQAETIKQVKNKVEEVLEEPINLVKEHVSRSIWPGGNRYQLETYGEEGKSGPQIPTINAISRRVDPKQFENRTDPLIKNTQQVIQESLNSFVKGTQPDQELIKLPSKNNIYKESTVYYGDTLPDSIKNIENPKERIQKSLNLVLNIPDDTTENRQMVEILADDLGKTICKMCEYQFEKGIPTTMEESLSKATTDLSTQYLEPYLLSFHKKVSKLINARNLGNEYAEIERVYNGLNMTLQGNLRQSIDQNKLKIYLITDEVGELFTHRENTSRFYLPSFDEYGGPYSRNKDAPDTISGLFYMMHDIDYTNRGYFDVQSDLKLISRLNNNIERFESNSEIAFANLAIQYFSTIGFTLGSFKGRIFGTYKEREPDLDILRHFQESNLIPKDLEVDLLEDVFNDKLDESVYNEMQHTAIYNPVKRNEFFRNKMLGDIDVYL